jgi:chemotaxis protein CheD
MSARSFAATRPFALPTPVPATVLGPGDVAVAGRGERLETLLGSCVAVVLTDPRRTVAAMCHVVHAGEAGALVRDDTAYARQALLAMFHGLRRLGIEPRLCEARVYGGGNMFPHLVSGAHVGDSNSRRVLGLLADARIDVLAQSLGGRCYRKLSWVVGPNEPDCVLVDVTTPLE